jgi:hypothetical protein
VYGGIIIARHRFEPRLRKLLNQFAKGQLRNITEWSQKELTFK